MIISWHNSKNIEEFKILNASLSRATKNASLLPIFMYYRIDRFVLGGKVLVFLKLGNNYRLLGTYGEFLYHGITIDIFNSMKPPAVY